MNYPYKLTALIKSCDSSLYDMVASVQQSQHLSNWARYLCKSPREGIIYIGHISKAGDMRVRLKPCDYKDPCNWNTRTELELNAEIALWATGYPFIKSYNQIISFILYALSSLDGTSWKFSGSTYASFCRHDWNDCRWSTQQKPSPLKGYHYCSLCKIMS